MLAARLDGRRGEECVCGFPAGSSGRQVGQVQGQGQGGICGRDGGLARPARGEEDGAHGIGWSCAGGLLYHGYSMVDAMPCVSAVLCVVWWRGRSDTKFRAIR